MPPKKSRSNSTRAKESSKILISNSVQTQTEDIGLNTIVLNYQQQIELLQQEIAQYKLQISELKSENEILKNQNNNVIPNGAVKIGLVERNALKIKNDKIASPRSATKMTKGCSCKGNCSNKICGCVKKGITCREFCRCNDAQCRNQEPDKENMEQAVLSQDGQKALEKFGRLTLNQEHLHASEKKSKRGMFSPFGDRAKMGNTDKSFEIRRRLLFTQESDDVVDVDNADNEDSLDEKLSKPQVQLLSQTPIAKRTRKLRYPEKNVEVSPEDDLQLFQQSKAKEVMKENKEIESLQNPSILITNINQEIDDDVFLPKTNKVVHSPRVTRKKSKSISPDQHLKSVEKIDAVEHVRNKVVHSPRVTRKKSKSVSPDQHVKLEQKTDTAEHIKNKHMNIVQQSEVEKVDNLFPDTNCNANSLSFESNVSESTSSTSTDILDVSLNPMVPKRQLPRSPINAAGNIIAPVEKKRFSPPKKELAVAEIDWEKHTSELVMCKTCKRKFFPHRINKHVISCKGI